MSSYLGFPSTDAKNAIFISYNTEDSNRIQPIVCKLHNLGVPLWYDYGLEYGESWSTQIAAHIDACRSVILFFSRNILEKENSFVRKEYKMAKEFYNKKVIVVLLDQVSKRDVPYHMVDWWIDISSDQNIVAYNIPHDDAFCLKLAQAAGFTCAKAAQPVKPEEATPPSPKPQPPSSPQPAPTSSIENWKEVQQRQLAKAAQTKQPITAPPSSKKPAVENWKEVQQRLFEESKQKNQQSTQPEPEPEHNSLESTMRIAHALKNAMDLVKYEILEFPREPLPTKPEPFRENWREVQQRQREKSKK